MVLIDRQGNKYRSWTGNALPETIFYFSDLDMHRFKSTKVAVHWETFAHIKHRKCMAAKENLSGEMCPQEPCMLCD